MKRSGASSLRTSVEALLQGAGTISADSVVSKTHHLVRPKMESTGSGSELNRVIKRAKDVLEKLAAGELAEWLERVPRHPSWRFRKSLPSDATRTRELQKL